MAAGQAIHERRRPDDGVESVNSLELRQTLFATQFPLEDYLESFMDPDANPVLAPYLSSVEPHLERLRDAGVKLPTDDSY